MQWKVSDMYTHSDHQAIIFESLPRSRFEVRRNARKAQNNGWKVKNLDQNTMEFMLDNMQVEDTDAEMMAKRLISEITNACDASMPRKGSGNGRPPVFWWNSEIASLRKECFKLRRRSQRNRNRPEYETIRMEFKNKRKQLRNEIKKSKSASLNSLREEIENNPWGSAYKIVLTKIKGISAIAPVCPELMIKIVSGLFPRHESISFSRVLSINKGSIPPVTPDEVIRAIKRVTANSAPGLDGIPNIVLKSAIHKKPEIFSNIYTACLKQGKFPVPWKRQRLVLIPKGDKPPEEPSSYRPLCMLDTAGKVFERIICNRIEEHTEGPLGLSKRQFGFRKQRSTVDAIETVCNIAQKAMEGTRWLEGNKQYCAVITLDVKNAFNSANWDRILSALDSVKVPDYLIRIIVSYFKARTLVYDTEEGPKKYNITGGVPQGSVLGPLLWNVMYDGVLRVDRPRNTTIIGYADDIAIVVVAKKLTDIIGNSNRTIENITTWLNEAGLELAEGKTEVVLMSSRKAVETIEIKVGQKTITSRPNLKYLGVVLDHRLNFKDHLEYAGDKAKRVGAALARLMPNIGGPKQPTRKLVASVNTSILMYAAPIWAQSTKYVSYTREVCTAHRLTSLRICSAFRTVSDDAVCIIASRMPIDIAAREVAALRNAKRLQNCHSSRDEILANSYREWQERWEASHKGRWTYVMIPDILKWTERTHGDMNYYLTQLISGHGCFREYLHKYKHVDDPNCYFCDDKVENAAHVLMECKRFATERDQIENHIREPVTPHGLVEYMLQSQSNWDIINALISNIMIRVRKDEQRATMSEITGHNTQIT